MSVALQAAAEPGDPLGIDAVVLFLGEAIGLRWADEPLEGSVGGRSGREARVSVSMAMPKNPPMIG